MSTRAEVNTVSGPPRLAGYPERWSRRANRQIFAILRERRGERALRDAPRIAGGVAARSGAFTQGVVALGSTREHLRPFLSHKPLLCSEIRFRIQSRHQIAISLQETRREYASTHVGTQAVRYRPFR